MRILSVITALLLILPAAGTDLPPRPSRFIVDPTHMLSAGRTDDLTRVLERHARDHETEVFLVLDRFPSGLTPDEYARKLGPAWSSKNWAVIIFRPGMIGAPGIATGGDGIKPLKKESWDEQVSLLRNLSIQHWDNGENLDFLARRMAEMITFANRLPDLMINRHMEKRSELKRDFFANRERKKILAIIGGGASLFLIAFLIFLIRRIRRKTRTWLFPTCRYSPRLGGKNAGGSDLCRSFPAPK